MGIFALARVTETFMALWMRDPGIDSPGFPSRLLIEWELPERPCLHDEPGETLDP